MEGPSEHGIFLFPENMAWPLQPVRDIHGHGYTMKQILILTLALLTGLAIAQPRAGVAAGYCPPTLSGTHSRLHGKETADKQPSTNEEEEPDCE